MSALLSGLETAFYMTNRLKVYWEYLHGLPEGQSRLNFETALTMFHSRVLQFLARAIQVYKRSVLSRNFNAFWNPDEISGFDSECEKIAARVEIEASNCCRTLSTVEQERAKRLEANLQTALKELEEIRVIKESMDMLANKIDEVELPSAGGAAFNSYDGELDARCHPDTRTDLLRQIEDWAEDPQGKCIFWLNGMAGTGKSTISRTVAQGFADARQLGASFFFKRGEVERGNASRLFTTIAAQLQDSVPSIIPFLTEAIKNNRGIAKKMLREQFENLIFHPLQEVGRTSASTLKLVIVVDALDECERDGDISTILHLLSQFQRLESPRVRVFLTSRPELPVRLGFKKMSAKQHQEVLLCDIPKTTIEHDISTFLKAEFKNIRENNNCSRPPSSLLSADWPDGPTIDKLTIMASPLFIYAATVCRFVGDTRFDPESQLATILDFQTINEDLQLDAIYLPILERSLYDLPNIRKQKLVQEFQDVVGSIVVLADPLSAISLASLLRISERIVDSRLDSLHSVLSIPSNSESPVRFLHLSFREFLLDDAKEGKSPFWVDKVKRHEVLATRCLNAMSEHLRYNICNLQSPGTLRQDIDSRIVDDCLPAYIRYACRHWVYHLQQSKRSVRDGDTVHNFLLKHFLHWLEALSFVGCISESIGLIGTLSSLIAVSGLDKWHFARIHI